MSGALTVRNLRVRFGSHVAVDGIDLEVVPGEVLGIVGESGSGKSVTARALIGLASPGDVSVDRLTLGDTNLASASEAQWRSVRGRRIALAQQDALGALDPLRRIGNEVGDVLRLHRLGPREARRTRVEDALQTTGLRPDTSRARAPQLSGGMRQRAVLAGALVGGPEILLADEVTTALDTTLRQRVLDLLRRAADDGAGVVLISHDLASVAAIADRVAVMAHGRIIESGPTSSILSAPEAAQTRELIASVPWAVPRGTALVSGHPSPPAAISPEPVLEASEVTVHFPGLARPAVDRASLQVAAGETLGLVGESGSGKSTLARALLGVLRPDSGEVRVDGRPGSRRGSQLGFVPQDPAASFDPRLTVAGVLNEALAVAGVPRRDRRHRGAELLEAVRMPTAVLSESPRNLSGGQRQRVAIARALAARPRVLVCDEPVSALDPTVQATVLDLLDALQRETGVGMLLISHDLGVIRHASDRIAVMREGRIVETGPTEAVIAAPTHHLTAALIDAAPKLG